MSRTVKIVTGVALVAAVFGSGLLLGRSRSGEHVDPVEAAFSIAAFIVDPGSGVQVPSGTPVVVSVVAQSSGPIASVELWADDLRVGFDLLPAAGPSTAARSYSWMPPSPGIHTLRARAVSADGPVAESTAIWLLVDPLGDLGQVLGAEDVVVVPAASGGGLGGPVSLADLANPPQYEPPGGPSPGAAVEAAQPFSGSSPLSSAAGPPSAPELVGEAAGCAVTLMIHDTSTDEDGFRVYRSAPGDEAGTVLELAAGDGLGWLAATDTVDHGSLFTYVVEPFNQHGPGALSNPVTLNLVAAGCPLPNLPALLPLLTEQFPSLEAFGTPDDIPPDEGDTEGPSITPEAVVQTYCYVSEGSSLWVRYPAIGFLDVEESGRVQPNGRIPAFRTLLEDGSSSGMADCWGWVAGALSHLGNFGFGSSTPERAELNLTPIDLASVPFGLGDDVGSELAPGALQAALALFDPVVVDPNMLAPRLFFSIDTLDCLFHRPPGADGYPHCHPGHNQPIYTNTSLDSFIPIENHPHSYLSWDLDDPVNCPAGSNCVAPGDMTFFPHSVEERGFRIYDMFGSQNEPIATVPSDHDGYVVIPKGCGITRAFEVRSYVKTSQPMTFESRTAQSFVGFQEPCGADGEVHLEVRFTGLTLADVDDGVFAESDLEIFGYLRAAAGSDVASLSLGGGFGESALAADPGEKCDTEEIELFDPDDVASIPRCPQIVTAGHYPMNASFLKSCLGLEYHYLRCSGTVFGLRTSVFNDTAYLAVSQGLDAISIQIDIWDHDHASANDPVCQGTIQIAKQPGETWHNYDGAGWAISQSDNGSASCVLTGTLEVGEHL